MSFLSSRKLSGTVAIPSSKSLSHRSIICAALADGESTISNLSFSKDIDATISILKNLGAQFKKSASALVVSGTGKLKLISNRLFCEESGSTLRFLIPVALLQNEPVEFDGKGKLGERPLDPYFRIFDRQQIKYSHTDNYLPLYIEGTLKPDVFEIPGNVSSQFISGLLFALPLLDSDSEILIQGILESKPYIDLTLDSLKNFGIKIDNLNYERFKISGNQHYIPKDITVEGDFSQAAFFLAAGVINGDIYCDNLSSDSLQGDKAIVDLLITMGGNITKENNMLHAQTSFLNGIEIDASQIPDIVPILAVCAAVSQGTTTIYNASRLRIKECDRLKAISSELNKIGADVEEKEDSLIIHGKETLDGGLVDSWNDHRIAMSMAIASLKCKNKLTITNCEAINKSYPDFYKDIKNLGGDLT
ncbi:3-phosphoshikimate 1-carboxyvinyltransferase [Clostridium oryzae]|uniref:3-phosphoshikimate 1-carboxyvinyltransferase n=1 Tax=Clostridium oryzae TaxID=1450648 RepID=UPI0009A53468|nr:3-phosphoshikimate 1-carboxyvinyltransferase [Clostridium oryzae]